MLSRTYCFRLLTKMYHVKIINILTKLIEKQFVQTLPQMCSRQVFQLRCTYCLDWNQKSWIKYWKWKRELCQRQCLHLCSFPPNSACADMVFTVLAEFVGSESHQLSGPGAPRSCRRECSLSVSYNHPGTEILIPRSQVQGLGPRTHNSEVLKLK